ncbi:MULTISPECIES: hypothetical protein [unclassified Roseofilum]|uniref:hypothetical protein n=1 Tax=unclassified Roseofilum TaxID=2620099 RepID=UPI000E7D446F|nr:MULTISPECIES: hypothetical protein [unclassified Roseofilum]HBQ98428.1 hypothetical protein [Cyanobacteria bacterium UBA11691]MBP0006967.1 hypothetical protein [Roseofilum sp. Belize Diploria]MBP0013472.1 hypothetical protein [Roseofilum sp. SID3]MBP0024669.1 hypothetical protein [Roseofilum sp. SID2]MBP0032874.1 hypothetical protein [Roseofilum sp. Belize BBD 4]
MQRTIAQLQQEIQSGESVLQEGIRYIQVACVRVTYLPAELQLFEAYQILDRGDTRKRDLAGVSEKLKSGEEPIQAAMRGIQEELDLTLSRSRFLSLGTELCQKISKGYNLPTVYTLYKFSLELNQEEFDRIAPVYISQEADKTTVFKWMPITPITLTPASLTQLQTSPLGDRPCP